MKATRLALAILAAAVGGLLIAQQQAADPTKAVYASKDSVEAALAKGGPALTPRASMISRGSDHLVAGGRRDVGGEAERHEKAYDIVYITKGEATYVTGGTLKNSKETGPGEMLGGTIDGGETHQLKTGDTIVVPPGVPHWWKDTKGVEYMIIKINKP
jgi:mannose-6-phosphate isomerase-like protein (cupin superfamily)